MKKDKKVEISKDTLIGALIEDYPELARVLVEDYGFHCVGCMVAGMETLEEGARVHGLDKKAIEKMVKKLRELAVKG